MTPPPDRTVDEPPLAGTGGRGYGADGTVLAAVGRRIRRDPLLVVPFALAGALLALIDWLRRWDPLPVWTPDVLGETITAFGPLVPGGRTRTTRYLGAFLDLEPLPLLWGIALELTAVLAVVLAGWWTFRRVLSVEGSPASFARYVALYVGLGLVPWLLEDPILDVDSFLVGVVLLGLVLYVFVRLFFVPALVAAGRGFRAAAAESARRSRGFGWLVGILLILFGVAYWGLVQVEFVGAFLSTAIVAPVHAVAAGVLLEWSGRVA